MWNVEFLNMWAAVWPNIPESGPDSIFGLTVDKVAHGTPQWKIPRLRASAPLSCLAATEA